MASDFLINNGVTYLNDAARGLESIDSVMVSGPRQIQVDFTADNPGDYVRVLTQFSPGGGTGGGSTPEPGGFILLSSGLAGVVILLRRRARGSSL